MPELEGVSISLSTGGVSIIVYCKGSELCFFGNAALSFPLIFPQESFLTQAVNEAALALL